MSGGQQLRWARLLLRALARAGVRSAVFSPGSRSTPLVLAARGLSELDTRVVPDERCAGFFALGQARASGRPALLVCTSGTAGAHYYPAVIEARYAGLPLIVLTADRPPELQERGAPQTIDQRALFGVHARYVDLGVADHHPDALRGLVVTIARIVAQSTGSAPGPVHLNVPFRKPFEPERGEPVELEGTSALLAGMPHVLPPVPTCSPEALESLEAALREARRPVAVIGPRPLQRAHEGAALALALDALGVPYAAEPASQVRFSGAGELALGPLPPLPAGTGAPDLVLSIGAPHTSSNFLAGRAVPASARRVALSERGFPNESNHVDGILLGDPLDALRRLATRGTGRDAAWTANARERGEHQMRAAAALTEDSARPLDDLAALRVALDALPPEGHLALGNSLPVRIADLVAPARGARLAGVLAQRGAAGIDGLAAGAAGAGSVLEGPLLLAYGDVSFAHDLGGVLAASASERPLVLLVLDNGGGRIFDELPIREGIAGGGDFERFFLTPPGLDALALARALGVAAEEAHDVGSLRDAIDKGLAHGGATVVVARIGESATRRALGRFRADLSSR